MKKIVWLGLLLLAGCAQETVKIDREALVERNNPVVREFEELSSLSVGNGNFAFTADATGLQTFPAFYAAGVPLGTQSSWGWHSFANPQNFRHEETLKDYDFRARPEPYAVQAGDTQRARDAAEWFRVNPHRLHLGLIGLELPEGTQPADLTDVASKLDMWRGVLSSSFVLAGDSVRVTTAAHPNWDMIGARVEGGVGINLRFGYPTGGHTDDANDLTRPDSHTTRIVAQDEQSLTLERTLDATKYHVRVIWQGRAEVTRKEEHYFVITPTGDELAFTCQFDPRVPEGNITADEVARDAAMHWEAFWQSGGAVDFSRCTDPRAPELERRVVLSQYLMAINSAGSYPPQETGLTYNSWYGRPHLEMHWWHGAHFALWNRDGLLMRSLDWYAQTALPVAEQIARRQGFKGVRWMKMTDPWAGEAPSGVGSFLIWQQPHFIYLAELIYRNNPDSAFIDKYAQIVYQTAEFMASFPTYEDLHIRYILKGYIPAQETLRAAETINSPFELSYWHFALGIAQQWRERQGLPRKPQWDEVIDKLSHLAYNAEGLYLASEDAVDTYIDARFTSDHMAVLGAVGILPISPLVRADYMKNTLDWIWDNWQWGRTWGWDYPMTAMNAARMGDPQKAVGALLMEKRTNTYLVNGHNYQDSRLRLYLPGNGGLLTAVAMMCAGWDGCTETNPGFPKDGTWDVVWEGLSPMP